MGRKNAALVIAMLVVMGKLGFAQTIFHSSVPLENEQDKIRCYEQAIIETPDSADLYFRLAFAYTKSGLHEKATEIFKKIVSTKPDSLDEMYRGIGSVINDNYSEYAPESPNVYHNLSVAYIDLGRYWEAVRAYPGASFESDKTDTLGKTFSEAAATYSKLQELAAKYRDEGNPEEASNVNQEAVMILQDFAPDSAQKYCDLCNFYCRQGRFNDAVKSCRQALRMKPNYGLAYLRLGMAYNNLGQYEKALDLITITGGLKPFSADVDLQRGIILGNLGRYSEEQMSYVAATADKPNLAEARYRLALSYLTMGDEKRAREQLKILRSLDKNLAKQLAVFFDK